jgi:hypothetical protein
MTVVPCGGNVTVPLLGCGPAEWWGVADDDAPDPLLVAVAVAVAAADTDALPDELLLAWAVLEAPPAAELDDDPPHAASSSTSDPSPVAAAQPRVPLLRITSLHSQG